MLDDTHNPTGTDPPVTLSRIKFRPGETEKADATLFTVRKELPHRQEFHVIDFEFFFHDFFSYTVR